MTVTELIQSDFKPNDVVQSEFDKEYKYVIERIKKFASVLLSRRFKVKNILEDFKTFTSDCDDFTKFVNITAKLEREKGDREDSEIYFHLREDFIYEYGNRVTKDPDIESHPETDAFRISTIDTERIRMVICFLYLKVIVEVVNDDQYSELSSRKTISIYVINRVDGSLIDYVSNDLVIWLDKGISEYDYIKRMAEKELKGENYDKEWEECSKLFRKQFTKYKFEQYLNKLREKEAKNGK